MIANIQDINTDLFYTLWLFMPSTDYHVLERTYPGQYIKDILWAEAQQHNRNNTRQYKFFPQHTNPNQKGETK